MNVLNARNETMAELRTELRERLGFVSIGPAASGNTALLNSFLREGHDILYAKLKPGPARKITTIRLMPGQARYDYHNDAEDENINPGSVTQVWLSMGGAPIMLTQGITVQDRSYATTRSYPYKYDTINGQMEIYTTPGSQYDLSIEYIAPKPRFVQDQDRPGVPGRLIFLYALANAKAHYRHPDATAAGASYKELLAITQADLRENRRYFVETGRSKSPEQVVSNADGSQTMRIGG